MMLRITAANLPISAPRLRELEQFCLQYKEKRRMLCKLSRPMGWLEAGGICHDEHEAAAWREAVQRDLEDIEQAALEACGDACLQQVMIDYVGSSDKPPIEWIPCGRRQFYERRRRFFVALHVRRVRRGLGDLAG